MSECHPISQLYPRAVRSALGDIISSIYMWLRIYYYLPHVVCWPLLLGHLLTRFRASLTLHAHLCLCALFLFSFTIHNIVSNQERSNIIISMVTHPLAMQLINATFTSFTFFHLDASIVDRKCCFALTVFLRRSRSRPKLPTARDVHAAVCSCTPLRR